MLKTYSIVCETRTARNLTKTLPKPEPQGDNTHLKMSVVAFYL